MSVVFVLAADEVFIFCFIFNDSTAGLVFFLFLLERRGGWGSGVTSSLDGGRDISEDKGALLEIQNDVFETDKG